MDNYNEHKDIFQDFIIKKYGVSKETNLPVLCNDMICDMCLFVGTGCTKQMQEWLKIDNDKYSTSTLMKKFTKIV